MNKDKLKELGLTSEQIDAVISEHKAELDGKFVTKEAFLEQSDKVKKYIDENNTLKNKIDDLSDSNNDVTRYKEQLSSLKEEMKELKKAHANELRANKTNYQLINNDVVKAAYDPDDVIKALDTSKFEYDDDGNIVSGLEDQLTSIKEAKKHWWPNQETVKPDTQEKNPLPFKIVGKEFDFANSPMNDEASKMGMEFAKAAAEAKKIGVSADVFEEYRK